MAQQRLEKVSDSPRLDAECLLGFVLQQPTVYLRTWPDKVLTSSQLEQFLKQLQRREQGEPIAYIIALREFWSLDLHVSAATLIPRPETELLVEEVLDIAALQPLSRILDLGTGSGAIAVALATEFSKLQSDRPPPQITATDISSAALRVARANAKKHQQSIHFIESDWFSNIPPQQFDVIVSNPPYIERDDVHLTQGDVRFEPLNALVSGHDGLDAIRLIVQQAQNWLKPGGWLLFEHGYQQGEAVATLLQHSAFTHVQTRQDLAKNDRVTRAKK